MSSNKRRIELKIGVCTAILLLEDFEGQTVGQITTDLKSSDIDDELYNAAIDGIESLILAQACAGIDVQSDAYLEALDTAIDAISNNL